MYKQSLVRTSSQFIKPCTDLDDPCLLPYAICQIHSERIINSAVPHCLARIQLSEHDLHEVKVDSLPTPNIDSLSKSVMESYKEVADSHNSAADNITSSLPVKCFVTKWVN